MKTVDMQKYTLEYSFKAPVKMLYSLLTTAEGLNRWYADKVILSNDIFHFYWEETEYTAKISQKKEMEYVHFSWVDGESKEYFEFRINTDSISNEVTLMITDFAYEDELKEAEMIWNSSINKLLRAIGAKISNINS